jgi:starch synthase
MTQGNPLRIVMIAAEASPFAKVGGLGDVVAALPRALEKLGAGLSVVIPAYGGAQSPFLSLPAAGRISEFDVPMASYRERAKVYRTKLDHTGVEVYLVGSRKYFDRPGIYDDPATKEGYPDNMERFVFFMKSALMLLPELRIPVDIVHCHDSHTALVPGLIQLNLHGNPFFAGVGTLLTMHNLAHQGIYPSESLAYAGIDLRHFYPMSPFEYWGQVNFMKAGIELADKVNTVSRTYALEIQNSPEIGMGLENVLRARKDDLSGIANGIDHDEWNPETDILIPAPFSMEDLSGKAICKTHVLHRFGLSHSSKRIPLIGIVSRLADQKGFDLIAGAMDEIASLDLQMVILGTGQQQYHDQLRRMAELYPQKLSVQFSFDNELAHQIEAGCDMFLMPSKFEPCGLNQLYSLRYGTVPIVRATGGLADTVVPYDGESGTGFSFSEYASAAMIAAIKQAIGVYADAKRWKALMLKGMAEDWSWARSASEYMQLYRGIHLKRHPEE